MKCLLERANLPIDCTIFYYVFSTFAVFTWWKVEKFIELPSHFNVETETKYLLHKLVYILYSNRHCIHEKFILIAEISLILNE